MGKSDPKAWLETISRCQFLDENNFRELCDIVVALQLEENNVQVVNAPVTVCGDVHGQFWDVMELLSRAGQPPVTNCESCVVEPCLYWG